MHDYHKIDWSSLFEYKDGHLYRKTKPSWNTNIGDKVGYSDGQPYLCVRHKCVSYKIHKIIWIILKGDIPSGLIVEHKDANPLNNKIENLRLATQTQNMRNTKKIAGASSIYKGVYFEHQCGKWRARIIVNKTKIHLGDFDIEEEAALAYNSAATKYFGEFARLNN